MPTYDYICLECNHTFEHFQKMTDELLSKCPECGGNLKRLIGMGAGTIFKGSGFYHTDYKNPPKKTKDKTKESQKAEKVKKSQDNKKKKPA